MIFSTQRAQSTQRLVRFFKFLTLILGREIFMKICIRNINYLIVVGFVWLTLGIAASAGTLTSVKVAAAPVIDGTPDASWSNAAIYTNIQFGGFLEDFLFTQEEFLQAMAN